MDNKAQGLLPGSGAYHYGVSAGGERLLHLLISMNKEPTDNVTVLDA